MGTGTADMARPETAHRHEKPTPAMNEPAGRSEVAAWRRAMRERLIERRTRMPAKERDTQSARIAVSLERALGRIAGRVIGVYWPIKGEPNLYPWIRRLAETGVAFALPVVIRKGWPLEFRRWRPGEALERGFWNIPVPANGPAVLPDVLVAPLVGFDEEQYRLGYGGGFYDRTIAAAQNHPQVIGVGFEHCRLPTIYPQPHDIRMDAIVTDA
jgi:5,10-methenyltetrahydrofolate synthetase